MRACDRDGGSLEHVQLFVEAGADVTLRDPRGRTAAELARRGVAGPGDLQKAEAVVAFLGSKGPS